MRKEEGHRQLLRFDVINTMKHTFVYSSDINLLPSARTLNLEIYFEAIVELILVLLNI